MQILPTYSDRFRVCTFSQLSQGVSLNLGYDQLGFPLPYTYSIGHHNHGRTPLPCCALHTNSVYLLKGFIG